MCADTKTLGVDRPERLGSPGAAAVSVESISVRVLQHSVGKEQKGGEEERTSLLTKRKKELLKELQQHRVTVKHQCMYCKTASWQIYF